MLEPKRTKYRKSFRGKMKGVASANNRITFGEFGIKAITRGWIKSREIEAVRRAVVGHIKRKGKVLVICENPRHKQKTGRDQYQSRRIRPAQISFLNKYQPRNTYPHEWHYWFSRPDSTSRSYRRKTKEVYRYDKGK